MKSISPNLNLMIKACEKASKVLIRDFGEIENLQVSRKGPKDFVTNADRKVEKIIIDELSKKNFSIISEEVGTIIKENDKSFWIIDPIDGTTNFLHGIPHFCISIAYIHENEVISGIIFDPIKNEMFFGEKNAGAFFNNHRMRVSNKKNLDECLFGSNQGSINNINLNIRLSGSAALDLAYVGCGRLDGFFQKNLNIWDIAAGLVIISEAGGKFDPINIKQIKNHKIIGSSETIYSNLKNILANF